MIPPPVMNARDAIFGLVLGMIVLELAVLVAFSLVDFVGRFL